MWTDKRFEYNQENLKSSNFNKYPHTIFATAFLADGKLADYKISNWQRHWGNRTFRGTDWENEILKNKKIKLTCEYNQIKAQNDEEHENAFKVLTDWINNTFEKYEAANLVIEQEDKIDFEKILNKAIKRRNKW